MNFPTLEFSVIRNDENILLDIDQVNGKVMAYDETGGSYELTNNEYLEAQQKYNRHIEDCLWESKLNMAMGK